jgi:hypothetical protein
LKKYTYTLTALSPVILSPRGSAAFYAGINYEKSVYYPYNVIYPFYQYGEYDEFRPDDAKYYIPGSSVKGALLRGENWGRLFVDDAEVKTADIGFASIIHASNVRFLIKTDEDEKSEDTKKSDENGKKTDESDESNGHDKLPKFREFFDGTTGVQCLKAGATASGVIMFDEKEDEKVDAIIKIEDACKYTGNKLIEYAKQLKRLKNLAENEIIRARDANDTEGRATAEALKGNFTEKLDTLITNIERLLEKNMLIFLGGYKGLLRSVSELKSDDLYKGEKDKLNPILSAVNVNAELTRKLDKTDKPMLDAQGNQIKDFIFDGGTLPYGIVKIELVEA